MMEGRTQHEKQNLIVFEFCNSKDLEERRMRIAQVYTCVLWYFLLKAAAFDVPF